MAVSPHFQILVILFWLTPFFQPAASLTLPWWFSRPELIVPAAAAPDNSTLPRNSSASTNTTSPVNTTAPAPVPIPSFAFVVPGVDLPSLKALNITNEDLHDPLFLHKRQLPSLGHDYPELLEKREEDTAPFCFAESLRLSPFASILSCINFLNLLGDAPCAVNSPLGTAVCSAGAAEDITFGTFITLRSKSPSSSSSSSCRDVARGAMWVLGSCQACSSLSSLGGTCFADGVQLVPGNDELEVWVTHTRIDV